MKASIISFLRKIIVQIWIPVVLFLIWEIVAHHARNLFIPSVSQLVSSSSDLIDYNWLMRNAIPSLVTILGGYFVGSLLGIIIGILIALQEKSRAILLPLANFLRAIPSVAKVPVFISLLGLSSWTRMTTVVFAVFFIVLLSTIEGVSKTNSELEDVAKVNHLSKHVEVLYIKIPGATNEILTGLHVALQVAVLVMVVSEMLGSGIGIGAFIFQSLSTFNVTNMWIGMLIIGILGVILNTSFLIMEKIFFRWRPVLEREL